MDSSTSVDSSSIPVELWKEILVHSAKSDLTRASRVNSQLLEFSRDMLYSRLFVWGDAHLRPILPALHNPENSRRLRHVVLDPGHGYDESSHMEELLGILRNSSVVRLDVVPVNGVEDSLSDWMHEILMQLVHLPLLRQLKVFLAYFRPTAIVPVLQVQSLCDLDISADRLLRDIPRRDASTHFGSSPLPLLNTLRIANSAGSWEKLLDYVDISRMKRLALWDYEQEMKDLENSWGKLVTASSMTLKSLSLWITPHLLDQDVPTYLRSLAGFPKLHTVTLFFMIEYRYPKTLWMSEFPSILAAFYSCSPSLRHIRVYVHAWNEKYSYDLLLQNEYFTKFAREMKELKDLETIEFSFRHGAGRPANNKGKGLAQLAELFHPVHLSVEHGALWNHAWPFFNDDRFDAEWARINEVLESDR
ncbi:hypothetical protein DL96DRAFT_126850 [Flagelloscypha sp. PMI_526]|nr:hypothetical protein DL96DRAFT_126850 [Flagelloscypha sp. PMI_526]